MKSSKEVVYLTGGDSLIQLCAEDLRRVDLVVQAIQHRTSRRIIHALEDIVEATIDVIARHLHIAEETVNRQLNVLKSAGIVNFSEGMYSIHEDNLSRAVSLIDDLSKA